VVCHYAISLTFTLLFMRLVPRRLLVRGHLWLVGGAYGLLVWTVMNCVVLPLSALASGGPDVASPHTYIGILVLMAFFGIPNAVGAARYHRVTGRVRTLN
jgi:hypothetical protein